MAGPPSGMVADGRASCANIPYTLGVIGEARHRNGSISRRDAKSAEFVPGITRPRVGHVALRSKLRDRTCTIWRWGVDSTGVGQDEQVGQDLQSRRAGTVNQVNPVYSRAGVVHCRRAGTQARNLAATRQSEWVRCCGSHVIKKVGPQTAADPPYKTSCTDGVFCNGAEQCQSGQCATGGDPCTAPSASECDEVAGWIFRPAVLARVNADGVEWSRRNAMEALNSLFAGRNNS